MYYTVLHFLASCLTLCAMHYYSKSSSTNKKNPQRTNFSKCQSETFHIPQPWFAPAKWGRNFFPLGSLGSAEKRRKLLFQEALEFPGGPSGVVSEQGWWFLHNSYTLGPKFTPIIQAQMSETYRKSKDGDTVKGIWADSKSSPWTSRATSLLQDYSPVSYFLEAVSEALVSDFVTCISESTWKFEG